MNPLPLADRTLTAAEVERIRLALSTYQDGSGMLKTTDGTLPGWRDFERSVAAVLGGTGTENKSIFDVVIPSGNAGPHCGVSCKMRGELDRVARDGRATIEVSNAAGEFWGAVRAAGVNEPDLEAMAHQAGCALGGVVHGWHHDVSHVQGGDFDLARSCYLVLLWNRRLEYQMYQYKLDLWDATKLNWSVPVAARRLCGHDGAGNRIEWYYASGGQLKLYPLASEAVWRSERFTLEPLPEKVEPLAGKAASYFPEKWAAAADK